MTELRAREKKKLFGTLLDGGITALHLDPRRPGVIVPGRFRLQNWLVLNYSYRYGIADFRFDEQVVEATLSFGGQPFYCRIPWTAVFAITDNSRQRGRIWHDEVPGDVDDAVRSGSAAPPTIASQAPERAPAPARAPAERRPALRAVGGGNAVSAPRRPGLKLISGGKVDEPQPPEPQPSPDEPDPPPPQPRPRGAHLRRIK